jgi:hypothetical protein
MFAYCTWIGGKLSVNPQHFDINVHDSMQDCKSVRLYDLAAYVRKLLLMKDSFLEILALKDVL